MHFIDGVVTQRPIPLGASGTNSAGTQSGFVQTVIEGGWAFACASATQDVIQQPNALVPFGGGAAPVNWPDAWPVARENTGARDIYLRDLFPFVTDVRETLMQDSAEGSNKVMVTYAVGYKGCSGRKGEQPAITRSGVRTLYETFQVDSDFEDWFGPGSEFCMTSAAWDEWMYDIQYNYAICYGGTLPSAKYVSVLVRAEEKENKNPTYNSVKKCGSSP